MLSPQLVVPTPRRVLDSLPTLATFDPQEACERVSSLFCPHGLQALGSRGRVKMNLRSTGPGFGVHLLDYGAPVRISPQALETFFMVQVPLAGRAQLRVGKSVIDSTPEIASVPPIDRDFSMTWESGTPQLIITAPREKLTKSAAAFYGADFQAPLKFASRMNVSTPAGQSFMRSVYEFHDLLNDGSTPSNAYTRKLQEETVQARWLMAIQSNFSSSLEQWESPVAAKVSSDLVSNFSALLDAHSGEDLGIGDLAEALGVSIRTLQVAVARHAETTPSQMLRETRLRRAHQQLLDADPQTTSVTVIAERCGFAHHGRFAQAYKRHYGFLPSQTLREPPRR